MDVPLHSDSILCRLSELVASPPGAMMPALSALLKPLVSHTALVTLAADASGGRVLSVGDRRLVEGIRGLELERLRRETEAVECVRLTPVLIDGREHATMQVLARNGALLVIADPGPVDDADPVLDVWNIVSLHMQERADAAAPDYLQHARATAGTRIKVLSELADQYTGTLESLLTMLRSGRLSDADARTAALRHAADGLVELRTTTDQVRRLTEEDVTTAFSRLKSELRQITRYRDVDIQFVDPPVDGRPLPGEVALGARAAVRRTVLAIVDQPGVTRIRIQWDCDGTNLLMNLRDDGPGTLTPHDAVLRSIRQRVHVLGGRFALDATPGWGTELSAVIPLDPPNAQVMSSAVAQLRPREMQVASLVAVGYRNRAIADELGISENTAKFHVSRILRKLGAVSRSEAAAILLAER